MMELAEIKTATNWDGIFQGKDCLVIKFDLAEGRKIHGLKSTDDTFYLDFPEFKNHPLSFMVTTGDEIFQYWTLGDKLHRIGNPAKIIYSSSNRTSHLVYYSNGLKHNTDGPAEIITKGQSFTQVHPKTQDDLGENYTIEEFDSMECYWFEMGIAPLYPKPFTLLLRNGHRTYRTTGTPVLSDFRDQPCMEVDKVYSNWSRENDKTAVDNFRLRHISAVNYRRQFQDGKFQKHSCEAITGLSWIIDDEVSETDEDKLSSATRDLFPQWNIWEGPLFADEQEKMFAMSVVR